MAGVKLIVCGRADWDTVPDIKKEKRALLLLFYAGTVLALLQLVAVHGDEEFLVVAGLLETGLHELHGFD